MEGFRKNTSRSGSHGAKGITVICILKGKHRKSFFLLIIKKLKINKK
jgi:hypothetical protein